MHTVYHGIHPTAYIHTTTAHNNHPYRTYVYVYMFVICNNIQRDDIKFKKTRDAPCWNAKAKDLLFLHNLGPNNLRLRHSAMNNSTNLTNVS